MSQHVDPLIDLYSFQTFKRLIPWPENCDVLYNFYVYYLGRRRSASLVGDFYGKSSDRRR